MSAINLFPQQKKSIRSKNETWLKECVDAGISLVNYTQNQGLRASFYEKQTNYDLASNILDPNDVERVVNPWRLRGADFPVEMRNYPLSKPKIDLLVGEEIKRRFDWRVMVKNDDAISDKEEMIKEKYMEFIKAKVTAQQYDEEKTQQELQKLDQWRNFEAQDLRERMGTQILSYLWRNELLPQKFNKGFEDAMYAGEEIYSIQIISGEPKVIRENPLNIVTLRSGDSPFIEDSDIIIKDGYRAIGQVIDDFYEYLSDANIKKIEEGNRMNRAVSMINYPLNSKIPIPQNYYTEAFGETVVVPDARSLNAFGGSYDTKGNIRVTQVFWKSLRKIGKLGFYDEDGNQQFKFVDEFYKADEALGEEIEWVWVNEWWQGTRIGGEIYVKMQPLPRIGLNMSNPSKCMPPFVGAIYNINTNRAMSLMSYLKPYQYLYNAIMYNVELAITKNKGKIPFLPIHLIPDGWDLDTWMYYFNIMGVAVIDAFKEGNKGSSTGKLAGSMTGLPNSMDFDMGNYIQTNVAMLQLIRQHVDEISGVTAQRQGQIDTRELVGSTERAVTQSSHITEKWFFIHEAIKVRVLEVLLETAKYAWRNISTLKRQYVMDDMTMSILNVDGENFASAEYSVVISNSASDMELVQALKGLAQAGLQNDKLNFSNIMDIYMSDSVSTMRRKIQTFEQNRDQQAQQQFQAEQENMQKQIEHDDMNKQADRDVKIRVAEIQAHVSLATAGLASETTETPEEDNTEKLEFDKQKHNDDVQIKRDSLNENIRKNKAKEDIDREKVKIARSKPKTAK